MKQLAIIVGLLLVSPPARPQSKNIHELVDPYTGLRTLSTEANTRTCPGDPSPGVHDPEVHLLFTAMQNPDNTVAYLLTPELDGASYTLGLRASATMDILIDGVPGSLSTHFGSTTTDRYSSNRSSLHETIPFDVMPGDLERLSAADWVQFRINGPKREVQRCIDAKRLRNLAEFLHAAAAYGPPQLDGTQNAPDPSKPFTEKVNTATHLRTLTFANIPTQPCPGDPASGLQNEDVRLAISANQRSDGGVWYYVATELYGGSYLNLVRGSSIEIELDGKPFAFHTINGSIRSYASSPEGQSIPLEATAFHVHQPTLIAISKVADFEFRISGPDGTLHRCVPAEGLKNLDAFITLAARYEPTRVVTSAAPR